MNYTKLPKKALLLLAAPVVLTLAFSASKLAAQSQTETKIRLMAEALRARDSGDLATAKTNLEQLLVLAPNDVTVQRLLAGVNDGLAKSATAPAVVAAVEAPSSSTPVEVTYSPASTSSASAGAPSEVSAPVIPTADSLAAAEEARVAELIASAKAENRAALSLAKAGDYDAADSKIDAAIRSLPVNTLTQETISALQASKNDLVFQKSQALLKAGDVAGAKKALDSYSNNPAADPAAVKSQGAKIDRAELNPGLQSIDKVSPKFLDEQKTIAALAAQGKSQYVAGDVDGAQATFRRVETLSSDNPEAKYFLQRIAEDKAKIGILNREKTRSQMLEEVAKAWQRPGVFVEKDPLTNPDKNGGDVELAKKLDSIIIPIVSFSGVELSRVVSTLSAYSEEFDPAKKGVNLVLSSPLDGAQVPLVNITLRNLSLKRILDIVTENVQYEYIVQRDLVMIKPSGANNISLTTDEFPVSQAALSRMTGAGAASSSSAPASSDPFAPAPTSSGGGSSGGEADAIKRFLSASGVNFDVPGSNLAYVGGKIIVTQTGRNLERIRTTIGRINDVRQVEIEAKFMDVEEGALDELGVRWEVGRVGANTLFTGGSVNRTLGAAFTSSQSSVEGVIITGDGTNIPLPNAPASIPGTVDLGGSLANIASLTGATIGTIDVNAYLRALSTRSGKDLLSAPKVTVLSGSRATITVAQELRYPQSYGETQSEVGTSSGTTTGGGAGVTITPGTPQDFTSRNVGVELNVTPTVEEDEFSISLELNPRVTEFEGFVEYGGQSVAISGGSIVRTPSGFYQPIFSLREINTRVTVWDGATLVMGGLTREEVKRVNDKVPFLGDIPFLGRAFRSKGEASQKRNLLIFVTANLVSPGGSLKKQELKGVAPSSLFQNPSVVSPGGSESRLRSTQ